MQRWTATCCKGASSTTIKRSILTWDFGWHYGEMKEDALQKGLPVPDEAAVREQVLRKNVVIDYCLHNVVAQALVHVVPTSICHGN